MSEQTSASDRQTAVDQAVRQATETAAERHPEHAGRIREALGALREHLGRTAANSATTADPVWSEYRDRLDRGLDELHIELADAAQQPGSVDAVLAARVGRLELDGWRLHFTTQPDAGAELERLRALADLDSAATPADVDAALAQLRASRP